VAVGVMVTCDVGAKSVSGLAETVNHCVMGMKWFCVPALYHATLLTLFHVAQGKPLYHPK
jgi:hypothetical protein